MRKNEIEILENKSLCEFKGKISPRLIKRKIEIYEKQKEVIDKKIIELEDYSCMEKYRNKTMKDIETEWNENDSESRRQMARNCYVFRKHIKELGYSEENFIFFIDEVFRYDFYAINDFHFIAADFYEDHCKKASKRKKP